MKIQELGANKPAGAGTWVRRTCGGLLLAATACGYAGLPAQEIQLGDRPAQSATRRQSVELDTAAVTVAAGKPDWVELRFRVRPGMHINSHTPHDELLVPTSLETAGGSGVKIVGAEYPMGIPLRLEIGQGETLSTYQGDFRLRLQVLAPKGEGTLEGTLRYQACDARSCFPPMSLPVRVSVTAR